MSGARHKKNLVEGMPWWTGRPTLIKEKLCLKNNLKFYIKRYANDKMMSQKFYHPAKIV